ncbi:MAG: ABC transporter ATP-binding protein [Deltaproteobacteria bacterium]|nr:ABC transporter ATP-binding protein [Deltaproteobacteria bacterium]
MISAQQVSLRLNGREILHQVDLTARPGEVTVLLGPNGSGKTTLFLCLSAQLTAERGAIFLGEQDLRRLSRRQLARRLATVPQEHHPVFPYLVRDLVLLGRLPRLGFFAQPRGADRRVVEDILELLGLTDLADKPYTRISGGERQLALIGRCLAQEPEILLLDEPTSHLDLRNQVMVLKLLKNLATTQKLTVLLTLHDPNLALLFADRVVLLEAGRVLAQGLPEDVVNPENIKKLYGLDMEMISQGARRLLYPRLS